MIEEKDAAGANIVFEDLPITMPIRYWKIFMANGIVGLDAAILYCHLYFTYYKNSLKRGIKANDIYLKNGLGWGAKKIKRAKAFLYEKKIIDYIQIRSKSGEFLGTRIQLNITHRYHNFDDPTYYYKEENDSQISLFEVENTGGSISAPAANFAPGAENGWSRQRYVPSGATRILDINKNTLGKLINSLVDTRDARLVDNFEDIPEDSVHTFCRSVFEGLYIKRVGTGPIWTGAEGDLLKRDLELSGMTPWTLTRYFWLFFDNAVPTIKTFVKEKGAGYSYRIFHSQIDKLAAWFNQSRNSETETVYCPVCEESFLMQTNRCPKCSTFRQDFDDLDAVEYFKARRAQ